MPKKFQFFVIKHLLMKSDANRNFLKSNLNLFRSIGNIKHSISFPIPISSPYFIMVKSEYRSIIYYINFILFSFILNNIYIKLISKRKLNKSYTVRFQKLIWFHDIKSIFILNTDFLSTEELRKKKQNWHSLS